MAQTFKSKTLISRTGVFSHEINAPNIVYNTGSQTIDGLKNFTTRPTVNSVGVLLQGEVVGEATLPSTILYTTGNQTISGIKTFSGDASTLNFISGAKLLVNNNPVITGEVMFLTGNQTIQGIKAFASNSRPTVGGSGVLLVGEALSSAVASGAGGSVFITDITANGAGNVGDKVYENVSDGVGNTALVSCSTTTQNVLVDIYALQGRTRFKPKIYITGSEITMTRQSDAPVFKATDVAINLLNGTSLRVDHEDGAYHTVSITQDTPPQVTSAYFYGGYPTSPAQTELKYNDTFNFTVNSDVAIVAIQIYDFGAARPATHNFTAATSKNITITIADRGNTTQNLGVKLRVQKANGSWSSDYLTSDYGSTDGVHTVKLNNLGPIISFGLIDYPGTQGALKNTESATVVNTVSNFNTISYISSELNITNDTTYESPKTVTRKSTGGTEYNVTSPNLTISATRTANNKSNSSSVLVKIANGTFTLDINTNGGARLRTGGNDTTDPQSYTVSITAGHQLASAPTLTAPAGGGSLGAFSGGGTSWSATLSNISDSLTKGTKNWVAISATNIAGTTVTTINSGGSYIIGGFVKRKVTVTAFLNTATINTSVSDNAKLVATWRYKASPYNTVSDLLYQRAVGTTAGNDVNAWAIDQLNNNPTTVRLLDTQMYQSVSQNTDIEIEETV